VLKTYGAAPYAAALKRLEKQIKEKQTSVNEKIGVKVPTIIGNQALRHS
jgi:26S proteasome regulatory subunit T1